MSRFTSLLLLTVIANIGMGIILPVLPIYFKQHGVGAVELSGPFVMLVAGRMVSRVLAPGLIARAGHRRAVMWSFAIYAVTFAAYLQAQSLNAFSALRFLEGIVEGLLAVALHDLAIAYTQGMAHGDRTRLMGRFSASFGLGFLLGPLMGSGLAWLIGMHAIFVAGSLLGAVAVGLAAWTVADAPAEAKAVQLKPLPRWRGAALLLGLYGPQCLRRVVFFSLMMLLPLQVTEHLRLGVEWVGLFFAASAILTTSLMPLAGWWTQRIGAQAAVCYGLLAMALSLAAMGAAVSPLTFGALLVVETIAFAFMLPPAMTVFSAAVDGLATRTRVLGNMAFATEVVSLPLAVVLPWCYARAPIYAWCVVALLCFLALMFFVLSGRALTRRHGALSAQPVNAN